MLGKVKRGFIMEFCKTDQNKTQYTLNIIKYYSKIKITIFCVKTHIKR